MSRSIDIQARVLNKLAELRDLSYYEIGEGPLYVHVGRMNPLYGRSEIEVAELMPYAQVKLPPDYFSDRELCDAYCWGGSDDGLQ